MLGCSNVPINRHIVNYFTDFQAPGSGWIRILRPEQLQQYDNNNNNLLPHTWYMKNKMTTMFKDDGFKCIVFKTIF